jgi:uncharacterized protein
MLPMTTRRFFGAATGVIALHVADDSFLQPQPGTSAADHLVSGLVPLAALALAIAVFSRLRAGAQGALALVAGAVGIGMGSEAIRYLSEGELGGDDYTGLLGVAAGVALIGLGAAILWRSRRLDDHRGWRYPRRALLAGAGFIALLMGIFPLMIGYGTTHIGRTGGEVANLGAAHENLTLHTSDGLDLPGWYIPSRNGAAVVIYPGRGESRQRQARMLARHGYGVLVFDRRGEGEADGDPEGFGWSFPRDIEAAVAYLQERPDVDPGRIGGFGSSVGGEAMLQAASETDGLAAVVSEGAGARTISEELADLDGAEKFISAPMLAVKTAAVAVFSDHAPPPDIASVIGRIAPRPVFLINAQHNEVDNKAPEYFAAAGEPKQLWMVPEGGHTGASTAMPREFERRVVDFYDRSLRGD